MVPDGVVLVGEGVFIHGRAAYASCHQIDKQPPFNITLIFEMGLRLSTSLQFVLPSLSRRLYLMRL